MHSWNTTVLQRILRVKSKTPRECVQLGNSVPSRPLEALAKLRAITGVPTGVGETQPASMILAECQHRRCGRKIRNFELIFSPIPE
jgi:hypothetical protein